MYKLGITKTNEHIPTTQLDTFIPCDLLLLVVAKVLSGIIALSTLRVLVRTYSFFWPLAFLLFCFRCPLAELCSAHAICED